MKYISTIKNRGIEYFLNSIKIELRKKIFIFQQRKIFSNVKSYSQYAEDIFINKYFKYKNSGFYIDIGAHHPNFLSNTKLFYDKGWQGMNIEPNPNKHFLFQKERTRDINLNIGISNQNDFVDFYIINKDTLSTFSKEVAEKIITQGYTITKIQKINVKTLQDVLQSYPISTIDFMSIDTEGLNLKVLQGNNWHSFRPKLICIEDETGHNYDIFMKGINYKKIAFNGLNSFFIDSYAKN